MVHLVAELQRVSICYNASFKNGQEAKLSDNRDVLRSALARVFGLNFSFFFFLFVLCC